MIQGVVNSRGEPTIPLRLRGPSGVEMEVVAEIDTGFTGLLALPSPVVGRLGLLFDQDIEWVLADSAPLRLGLYSADVDRFGDFRPVLAAAVGDVPLVGTRLLEGHQMWAEFAPGGAVTLEPLP